MSLISAIGASASGLTAERLRMEIIANNIANVNTTRAESGEPFRRQFVLFIPRPEHAGVHVPKNGIRKDYSLSNPLKLKFDPGHPDADENGYVHMPNVNIVTEMVDLISATRAYEANVMTINAAKAMGREALTIGRSS
jgi:flagellar basal-body rod protein FlgC